jgi:hypothetical protein
VGRGDRYRVHVSHRILVPETGNRGMEHRHKTTQHKMMNRVTGTWTWV